MTFRFSIPFLTIQSKAPTVERNKLCRLEILFVFVFSLPQLFSSLTYAFAQATTYTARDAGAPNIGGGVVSMRPIVMPPAISFWRLSMLLLP